MNKYTIVPNAVFDAFEQQDITERELTILIGLYRMADFADRGKGVGVVRSMSAERVVNWLQENSNENAVRRMRRSLAKLRSQGWFTWDYRHGDPRPYHLWLRDYIALAPSSDAGEPGSQENPTTVCNKENHASARETRTRDPLGGYVRPCDSASYEDMGEAHVRWGNTDIRPLLTRAHFVRQPFGHPFGDTEGMNQPSEVPSPGSDGRLAPTLAETREGSSLTPTESVEALVRQGKEPNESLRAVEVFRQFHVEQTDILPPIGDSLVSVLIERFGLDDLKAALEEYVGNAGKSKRTLSEFFGNDGAGASTIVSVMRARRQREAARRAAEDAERQKQEQKRTDEVARRQAAQRAKEEAERKKREQEQTDELWRKEFNVHMKADADGGKSWSAANPVPRGGKFKEVTDDKIRQRIEKEMRDRRAATDGVASATV